MQNRFSSNSATSPTNQLGYPTFSQVAEMIFTSQYITYDEKTGAVARQGYAYNGKKYICIKDVVPHADTETDKYPDKNTASFQELIIDPSVILSMAAISEYNGSKALLSAKIIELEKAITDAKALTFDTSQITDGAVTAPKLSTDSVTTDKIVDGSITEAKIHPSSITDASISSSGISLISDNAIATKHIQDGSVTKGKMDLTGVKLTDLDIDGFIVDSSHIKDETIENRDIKDATIMGIKIAPNVVTGRELEDLHPNAVVLKEVQTFTFDAQGRMKQAIPRLLTNGEYGDASISKQKLDSTVTGILNIIDKDSTAQAFVDKQIGKLALKDTSAFHIGVDGIVATAAADTTTILHSTIVDTVKDVLKDTTSSVSLVTKDVMDAEFASRDSSIYTMETDINTLYQQDATLEAGINTLDTKIEDVKTANIADITNLQARVRRNENARDSHAIRIAALENGPTASTVAKVFNFTGVTTTIGDEDIKVSDVFVVADTANNTSKAYRVKTATPKGSNLTTLIANSEVIEDAQIKFNREQHNLLKAEVNILKLDITTMEGSIQAQDNKLTAQDAKIAVLDSAVADIDSKAATALAESQANHNAILQVEQDTSINSQNIASQGATLGQHGARLDTLENAPSDDSITTLNFEQRTSPANAKFALAPTRAKNFDVKFPTYENTLKAGHIYLSTKPSLYGTEVSIPNNKLPDFFNGKINVAEVLPKGGGAPETLEKHCEILKLKYRFPTNLAGIDFIVDPSNAKVYECDITGIISQFKSTTGITTSPKKLAIGFLQIIGTAPSKQALIDEQFLTLNDGIRIYRFYEDGVGDLSFLYSSAENVLRVTSTIDFTLSTFSKVQDIYFKIGE